MRTTRRSLFVAGVAAAIIGGTAGSALANDCANLSRVAPACYYSDSGCTTPVVRGHWVFLPSVDPTLPPVWGFGAPDNFTNGQTDALTALGNISSGGAVCATPNRQFTGDLSTVHGVLSTDQCFGG